MRVLHVLTRARRRGAETFGTVLDEELRRRGIESRVVALAAAPPGDSALDVPVLGPAPRHPRTLRALRREASGADVVVAHGSSTLVGCRLALLGSGVPFVYVNIGDPGHWSGTPLRRRRVRWLLRGATRVGAISATAAERLVTDLGVPAAAVRFTGNGRRAEEFRPATQPQRAAARRRFGVPDGAPTAVLVAALGPEKRVDLAIAAVGRRPGWRLLVVGTGPLEPELRRQAEREAPARVTFAGGLADVVPAYHAADVAVLTSVTEGLPGVLIEAAMCGLPVVATDVGFVGDVVADGVTGRLVPRASADLVAGALAEAWERRADWGPRGRRLAVERYDLPAVVDRWCALLAEAVRPRG